MKRSLCALAIAGALAFVPSNARAEGAQDAAPNPLGDPAQETEQQPTGLLVFLDCGFCDFDYLRREITFVNYVRDR